MWEPSWSYTTREINVLLMIRKKKDKLLRLHREIQTRIKPKEKKFKAFNLISHNHQTAIS